MQDTLLAEIYARESRALVGMLWVFTGDKQAAEDVAQEAFVRFALNWHRVRGPARAGAYLRSIAFNMARGQERRRATARRHPPTTPDESQSAEAAALLNAAERDLLEALRTLPTANASALCCASTQM